MMLRLPSAITLDDLTHEWVFGNADGTGVRVAVIDSGIDADHPFQRALAVGLRLVVGHQLAQFRLVRVDPRPAQRHVPGGKLVSDAKAGRAEGCLL